MFHDRRRILINQGVATMTIETTSTSASWSPNVVVNTGSTLIWEVSGGVTIPPTTIDDPTFDLSTNTGTAIITAKDVGFLTSFEGQTNANQKITSIDVSEATRLFQLGVRIQLLTTINLTNNVDLEIVFLDSNNINSLDVSNNILLRSFWVNNNNLTELDISNNPAIINFRCQGNPLTSTSIDNLLIDLDNHGLSNGTANIPLGRTSASDTAYYNLETVKNWNITES